MQLAAKKVVIVGGVAGGATAAARARRLDEHADIFVLERGSDISFANCGYYFYDHHHKLLKLAPIQFSIFINFTCRLPYHISGEVPNRDRLLLHTPQSLEKSLNIKISTFSEVVQVNRQNKSVSVINTKSKKTSEVLLLKYIFSHQ